MNYFTLGNKFGNGGVSTDISVSYVSPAKSGDVILIECFIYKIGKNLANTYTVIRNKINDKVIAIGQHTKFNGKEILWLTFFPSQS